MIKLALDLYAGATLGCSKVASVLKVIFGGISLKTPHHTTIRSWVIRHGCYCLNKPIVQSNDLVGIGDMTISLGKLKCLAILGVRSDILKQRKNYTLSHSDVEILGLHLTEKATGEFSHKSFETTYNRVGAHLLGVVVDQGPDLKKGLRLFRENHPDTLVIHDIPHKMSLVLEHWLKDDPRWIEFTKKLLETKRCIQQTELAAMAPPTQRSKARFMDIGYMIDYTERILECKRSGRLDCIPEERYQHFFGWIEEFEVSIWQWRFMVDALNFIKNLCRKQGLSHETTNLIRSNFDKMMQKVEDSLKEFLMQALRSVEEESAKLKEGQVIVCSTEVLESIFGKYKELNSRGLGIGSNILGLATFIGPKSTEQGVKEAMENCSMKASVEWIKQQVSDTLGSLRRRFFHGIKRTKFDSDIFGFAMP